MHHRPGIDGGNGDRDGCCGRFGACDKGQRPVQLGNPLGFMNLVLSFVVQDRVPVRLCGAAGRIATRDIPTASTSTSTITTRDIPTATDSATV